MFNGFNRDMKDHGFGGDQRTFHEYAEMVKLEVNLYFSDSIAGKITGIVFRVSELLQLCTLYHQTSLVYSC